MFERNPVFISSDTGQESLQAFHQYIIRLDTKIAPCPKHREENHNL